MVVRALAAGLPMHTVAALRDAESGGGLGPLPQRGAVCSRNLSSGLLCACEIKCLPAADSFLLVIPWPGSRSPACCWWLCARPEPQQNALSKGSGAPRCLLSAPQSLLTLVTSGPPPPPLPSPRPSTLRKIHQGSDIAAEAAAAAATKGEGDSSHQHGSKRTSSPTDPPVSAAGQCAHVRKPEAAELYLQLQGLQTADQGEREGTSYSFGGQFLGQPDGTEE